MSRITKWKLDKTKVKVVFRLQFHATHIPQTGWEKLFISFIPTESGKVTAKTTKANVRNGACKWGDPIYETTRLLLDAKSKQFDDKLYKLVVGMGTSRSSILGEATINLADYADALKPSAVTLPLHGSETGTILHVTVQLLTSKTGFREFEQQRELREKGLPMGSNLSRHEESGTAEVSSPENISNNRIDKANPRVRSATESKLLPALEEVGASEEYADSQVGCDGSSNTSGSLYADKHDSSSTHEIDSLKSAVSGDLNCPPQYHSPKIEKGDPSDHRIRAHGTNEWVHGWSSDCSVDNDLVVASEENNRLRGSLEAAESSIFELKLELSALQSHAEEIGFETQKFADQLVTEIASGQELVKELTELKSQCSKFKDDVEQLKSIILRPNFTIMESGPKQDPLSQKEQIRWLNGLLVVEDRIRELQEKAACRGLHETDISVVHSDLQVLLNILQDLKKGTVEAISLPGGVKIDGAQVEEIPDMSLHKSEQLVSGSGFDVDLYDPESILQYVTVPSLVAQEPESTRDTEAMARKNIELIRQLDDAKIEKETLVRKTDQMECYYEALVQELEENQKQILGELHSIRNDHSTCLYTISTNKAEMESLRHDMNDQTLKFAEERVALNSLNKELERRSITSEAALKRARLNYSIAVGQLQKDLDLLSFQVLSMFETNQNLIKDSFSETSQLFCQGYPDIVQNPQKSNASIYQWGQNQTATAKNHLLGGEILSDDLKKSLSLQEDLYQKVEVELCEMRSANLYLDMFSKTLKETLLEANKDIRLMKEKIDEYAQQLEFSNESRNLLVVSLRNAMEDVHTLNEDKAGRVSQCSDLLVHNQILEAKLESISNENFVLTEKVIDYEALIMDYKGYERKYEACFAEKLELEKLLKLENLEKSNIQKETSSLKEELKTLKNEFETIAMSKESMQKLVTFLRNKLGSLLASHNKHFDGLALVNSTACQNLEFKDIKGLIMDLEDTHLSTCEKIFQFIEEKKVVENERDMAVLSLSTARSEIWDMKQRFKHDIQDTVAKLNMSNLLVEKLQLQLESIADKFHNNSEIEEKYAQHGEELLAYLASLELELQKLSSKNSDLAQEILDLDAVADELERSKMTISELVQEKQERAQEFLGFGTMVEELGRSKVTISELVQEKQELVISLQSKTEGSIKLESELERLAEELARSESTISVLMQEKQDRAQEILDLGTMAEEHGRCKLTISELMQEKKELVMSLQSKTEESIKLESEVERLAEELGTCKLTVSELMQEKQELAQMILRLDTMAEELAKSKLTISALMQEKQDIALSLHSKTEESIKLESALDRLAEELERNSLAISELMQEKQVLAQTILGLEAMAEELGGSKRTVSELMEEKQEIVMSLQRKTEESIKLESELDNLAEEIERSKLTISELTQEKQDLAMSLQSKMEESIKLEANLEGLTEDLERSKLIISGLMKEKHHLEISLQSKTEKSIKLESEFDRLTEEIEKSKLNISELMLEKLDLAMSLQNKSEESIKLESELDWLKECLRCVHDEMHVERGLRDKLEGTVEDLTSQLNKDHDKLLQFEHQNAELVHFRQLASDLELENSRVLHLLEKHEENVERLHKENDCFSSLECELMEMQEHLIGAEVKLCFVKAQYGTLLEEIGRQLQLSNEQCRVLEKNHFDAGATLSRSLASEADYIAENGKLLTALESLKSESEALVVQNGASSVASNAMMTELEEYKSRLGMLEVILSEDNSQHAVEVEQLKLMLADSDQEIDSLILAPEESDIIRIVLKAKLDEQYAHLTFLEERYDELMLLRDQCDTLQHKLSEQILKTKEFKNLSIYLRELKDKADAESALAREKREPEVPSGAVQESLRIAFIKEQYETRLQELRQQLSISKRHGEELLFKLQDAIDETENRKKAEASHLRKNEELSLKVLELEAELQSVITDKREKVNAYDRIKTELECTLLSLECCKEEKEKLSAFLQECEEEKSNMAVGLSLIKGQMNSSSSHVTARKEENGGADKHGHFSDHLIRRKPYHGNLAEGITSLDRRKVDDSASTSTGNAFPNSVSVILTNSEEVHDASSIPIGEVKHSTSRTRAVPIQGLSDSEVDGTPEIAFQDEGDVLLSNSKRLAVVNDHFRSQSLKSSMEHLDEELERMKKENLLLPLANLDPTFQDLQKELERLQKANQELASIYPLFSAFTGSGNALERVLALEIELAEALRAKKKSSIQFQSSFLKQHGDEEAVFKSFRDINELIRDMLELKGKYTNVETELKEMHDRYSQLSLQFAEVEGERQKLTMTLKNVRASKKQRLQLNRSSSAT